MDTQDLLQRKMDRRARRGLDWLRRNAPLNFVTFTCIESNDRIICLADDVCAQECVLALAFTDVPALCSPYYGRTTWASVFNGLGLTHKLSLVCGFHVRCKDSSLETTRCLNRAWAKLLTDEYRRYKKDPRRYHDELRALRRDQRRSRRGLLSRILKPLWGFFFYRHLNIHIV